jgi:hypothetical protein
MTPRDSGSPDPNFSGERDLKNSLTLGVKSSKGQNGASEMSPQLSLQLRRLGNNKLNEDLSH